MSKQKVKIVIEIEFEDISDYKMHQSAINARVNSFLKNGNDILRYGSESTAWSRHTYSIETIEKK